MKNEIVQEKAKAIRDVIRYINRFQKALVVIYLDDKLLDTNVFLNHIKDISLLHKIGLRVIIVPGAAKRIDEILTRENIEYKMIDGSRVTTQEAIPLIKMAAFDVSNQVMTALAGEKITALIGNWVRARSKGIRDGQNYSTVGDIDHIEIDALNKVLADGFIPIFPCIGWSLAGKPYNISSMSLAQKIAIHLNADKLFYLVPNANISNETFILPENLANQSSQNVPAMDLEELDSFVKLNENKKSETGSLSAKILFLLSLAKTACSSGVSRVHILDGASEGTIPCEIFSDFGSGTMIYTNNYGKIRDMTRDDIPAVLNLMQPFVDAGKLLPRTKQGLDDQFAHYIVFELDGAIRACSSLIPYPDGQMEIAGVAVEKSCSHIGIGPKMIDFLIKRAKERNATGIFLLTTQAADWFENLGFTPSDVASLPPERQAKWTPERGSLVFRLNKVE